MKNRAFLPALLALILIGAATAFLATYQKRQRLGNPGVRVVSEPTYSIDVVARTNPPTVYTNISVFLPPNVLHYRSQPAPISSSVIEALPKDTTFGRRIYFAGTNEPPIDYQVVLMGTDRTSIHEAQVCLKGSGVEITSSEAVTIRIASPHAYDLPIMKLKFRREVFDEAGGRRTVGGLYVYWFVADNQLTVDHLQRVWWMARDVLWTGVLQRWAYVICVKTCELGEEDRTYEQLKEFIAASVPEFQLTAGPSAAEMAAAK
jgi:hypothetical protein